MDLQLKSIHDLHDYTFIIPPFQRGYRWDYEQVEALLEDLYDYCINNNGDYYCLQPVVVVPKPQNGKDVKDCKTFEVIDGQQRLTTIYLILSCIEYRLGSANIFQLKMPMRERQEEYLSDKKFKTDNTTSNLYIDNFYVKKAYDTINKIIENDNARRGRLANILEEMLYTDPSFSRGKVAKVIWYPIDSSGSYQSFIRLNNGKISLTSADLVKALLLQSDCYGELSDKAKELSDNRSHEWNFMEQRLREESYRGFLGIKLDNNMSLMDVVLNFVADKLNDNLDKRHVRRDVGPRMRDYFNFNVIAHYIKNGVDKVGKEERLPARMRMVDEVWREIVDVFNQLRNWHDDRIIFHYIGLYSLLTKEDGSLLISKIWGIKNKSNTKDEFKKNLRQAVWKRIAVRTAKDENGKDLPEAQQGLNSPELTYKKNPKGIERILIAHNVWTILKDNDYLRRFPFLKFRNQNPTSLEHIHPQNIEECERFEDYEAWFDSDAIDRLIEKEDNKQELINAKGELKTIFDELSPLEKNKRDDEFSKRLEEIREHTRTIDRVLMKMAEISEPELHHIKNMALVDQATNSALQNYLLDAKRKILNDRITRVENPVYIPQATLNVFAKHYSAGNVKEMRFWGFEDRNNYLADIQKAYDYFRDSENKDVLTEKH